MTICDSEIRVYEQKPIDFLPQLEVSAIFITFDDKLLFLQRSHSKHEPGAWGVPAGKLEANETSLKAAGRELFEETGIDLSVNLFQALGSLYIHKPEIEYIFHLFGITLDHAPIVKLSKEHVAYRWVSREEAESLPLMNAAKEALAFYFKQYSKK